MNKLAIDLDKSLESELDSDFGTITIRVVVLQKGSQTQVPDEVPILDVEPDENLPEDDSKRPIDSYLEVPSRGKLCCVFLVNGQRQHAWTNDFIVRDLQMKYLRNRMLVIVDVDGLKPQAIAKLMQGSRHQFYEGEVYDALTRRMIGTLKGDQDLLRLEADAEQEVSSLKSGDEVVKAALDELIDSHHEFGSREMHGHNQGGAESRDEGTYGHLPQKQTAVTEADITVGLDADAPVLTISPDLMTVRLKPNEDRRVSFYSKPEEAWSRLDRFAVGVTPPVKELQLKQETHANCAIVDLNFDVPDDFDDDEYPIVTTLRATAQFKGAPEPRICERRIIINKPALPPPPPPELRDEPTYIRITSRQPVRMTIAGPDLHVKLKWDGKDSLLAGELPVWKVRGNCLSGQSIPVTFSRPSNGRFEALVRVPENLKAGDRLEFQVEAVGPNGKMLSTSFQAEAVEPPAPVPPPSPRLITEHRMGGSQRKSPYELVYIQKDKWDSETCWGTNTWSERDPGCFQPPSQTGPLTLIINQDFGLLATYRDSLVSGKNKLAEMTVQERITRYTSHIAFHLWQMYNAHKRREEARAADPNVQVSGEDEQRGEINRVAETLIKIMQVSR